MQLNKDNFGNFGSLNALYVVGNAADTLGIGQQKIAANKYDGMTKFNQAPLRCHQCDSLFSEANVSQKNHLQIKKLYAKHRTRAFKILQQHQIAKTSMQQAATQKLLRTAPTIPRPTPTGEL
jgi:hypothetical protein